MLFYLLVAALLAIAVSWLVYGAIGGVAAMLAAVLVFSAIFYVFWKGNEDIIDQFVLLAQHYGLKYKQGDKKHYTIARVLRIMAGLEQPEGFFSRVHPTVSGVYLDRFMRVAAKAESKDGKTGDLVLVEVDVVPYGNTFAISPETLKTRLKKKALFKQDVLTGDEGFDSKFFVEGDAKFVAKLLDPPIIEVFRDELFANMGEMRLEQGILRYSEQGLLNEDHKRERIEKVVWVMYMIARKLDFLRLGK